MKASFKLKKLNFLLQIAQINQSRRFPLNENVFLQSCTKTSIFQRPRWNINLDNLSMSPREFIIILYHQSDSDWWLKLKLSFSRENRWNRECVTLLAADQGVVVKQFEIRLYLESSFPNTTCQNIKLWSHYEHRNLNRRKWHSASEVFFSTCLRLPKNQLLSPRDPDANASSFKLVKHCLQKISKRFNLFIVRMWLCFLSSRMGTFLQFRHVKWIWQANIPARTADVPSPMTVIQI